TGIVSAIRENGLDSVVAGPLLQISAPISPGSSGSPVMNRRGEVLGVAVAVHRTGQNLNFAVPTPLLQALLQTVDSAGSPVRVIGGGGGRRLAADLGGAPLAVNLLVSALFFAAVVFALRKLR
ncbi:MAG: trypsin-like peptidase domain-containing protein, partial [Acidobacteriota bacterium]